MKKAKKPLHRMPKLSLPDQAAYWTGLILLCILYFLLALGPMVVRDKLAFSDEAVIAITENASAFWALLPCMIFFLATFIPWCIFYNDRRPIFGLKNFRYGPPAWPRIYPLFMKNKPYVWVSEKKQKEKKQAALFLVLLVLVSFLFYPLSLFGRDCLMTDGSIRQYSMFNRQTAKFLPQEIEAVEFSVYKYSTGKYNRTTHWDVRVTFTTDSGRDFPFESRDFRRDRDRFFWMTEMLRLKSQFDPSVIRHRRTEDVNRVAMEYEMTDPETLLLYRLFDLSSSEKG